MRGLEEKYRMMPGRTMRQAVVACDPHPDFQHRVERSQKSTAEVIISNKGKTLNDAINQDNTVVGRLIARLLSYVMEFWMWHLSLPAYRRRWQRSVSESLCGGFVTSFSLKKREKGSCALIKRQMSPANPERSHS